jgi:hypothetical protein
MRRAAFLVLTLAACSQPAHSVDWFVQHPADASETVDRCLMRRQSGQACDNASKAVRIKQDQRLQLYRKSF